MVQKKNVVMSGTKGRFEKPTEPEQPLIMTPKAVKTPKKKARKTKKNG